MIEILLLRKRYFECNEFSSNIGQVKKTRSRYNSMSDTWNSIIVSNTTFAYTRASQVFHHRVIFSQNFNVNKTRLAELFRDTVSNKYKLPSACSYTPIPSNEARILVPAGKQDGTLFSQKSRAEGAQAPLSLRERNGNAGDEGGMERKKTFFLFTRAMTAYAPWRLTLR